MIIASAMKTRMPFMCLSQSQCILRYANILFYLQSFTSNPTCSSPYWNTHRCSNFIHSTFNWHLSAIIPFSRLDWYLSKSYSQIIEINLLQHLSEAPTLNLKHLTVVWSNTNRNFKSTLRTTLPFPSLRNPWIVLIQCNGYIRSSFTEFATLNAQNIDMSFDDGAYLFLHSNNILRPSVVAVVNAKGLNTVEHIV